jgi:hypothetical protein
MQRNHNFSRETCIDRNLCWSKPAPSNASVSIKRSLVDIALGTLRGFIAKPPFPTSARETLTAQSISLEAHGLWSGVVDAETIIHCERGTLWLTRSGDWQDYILHAGQTLNLSGRTKIVASTFAEPAEISIKRR